MSAPSVQFELAHKRVYVAGHRGMVGSAIVRRLSSEGCEILTANRRDLDLRRCQQVDHWMGEAKPDAVFLAAGKVGGIYANSTYPADFIADNLAIALNVIRSSYEAGVQKLLFLGSSCIFPRLATQPISEEALLTGPLEPTNEWYAIAKIAGIKLCQAYRKQYGRRYISVMPCNLYGPGDNFDALTSHVLPALIRRFHEAKLESRPEVVVWGTGRPLREFLHVDDLARGVAYCLDNYDEYMHINCGAGSEVSIKDLAELIASIIAYGGKVTFDTSKSDGTPRKLMDSSRLMALGWRPEISLESGIKQTYNWFLKSNP